MQNVAFVRLVIVKAGNTSKQRLMQTDPVWCAGTDRFC